MDMLLMLEIFAVASGLLFVVFLMAEKLWSWFFGIASSIAFVFIMYYSKLYSEAILYLFYVLIGVYGLYQWSKVGDQKLVIKRATTKLITILILLAVLGSFLAGYFFYTQTDAARPYADAGSTVFSMVASYMQAHKILSSWIFWIGINAFSIWLYLDRSLRLSAFLMLVYFLLSIIGYLHWKRKLVKQESTVV